MKKEYEMSRRGFLKTAAAVGAALTIQPTINKVKAANAALNGQSMSPVEKDGVQCRTLGAGNAVFEVSALGFGVMGMNYNRSQSPDKKECIRIIHEAVDRGVTLFDTAIIYGPLHNELLAGEALEPYKGRVNVTTKFGHEVINGKGTGRQDSSPATVRRYCEESLKRLRIDSIPLFYQHRFDPNVPIEEVASTIGDLIKEGKVQRWGLCEVSVDTIRRAHAVQPLTAIQSEYHLMHRLVEENGVLDVCRQLGIGFVPYSPINRGFLGGCINEYTVFDTNNDNRHTLPRFQPEAIRANTRIVNVLQQFGRTRGMTSAQVALGWLLQKEPWIVPIPGTTKLSHLDENLHTLSFNVSPGEWKELEDAVAAVRVVGERYNAEQQKQVGH
ncbi:aldo/keto reductase [Bacteroides oleiciplenus]|uniref:Tat (Twin-arginine translocation) pathway signal sequence n=1 Tax=Bacteroides oleiciplenus YIT 12058 TaxID=742727 RepID=K9ELP0_9BACE|nr:aldo/keto reductase [Bacteroides oleiciplenus]EKU91822.1 tat (twin-arginine translocation) pathway signal sequence [Bacteroides oleiciplenus YIT 12058]